MAAGEERRRHAVLSRVRRVQRRLNVQVWAEAAVAPTWGGVTLLVLGRVFLPVRVELVALVALTLWAFATVARARPRRVGVSEAAVVADRQAGAGGLLLTRLETPVGAWELGLNQQIKAIRLPSIRLWPSALWLLVAMVFAVAGSSVPRISHAVPALNTAAASRVDALTDKVEALAREELVPEALEAEVARLQAELDRGAFAATDWEAADSLEKSLDARAATTSAALAAWAQEADALSKALGEAQGAEGAEAQRAELEKQLMQLADKTASPLSKSSGAPKPGAEGAQTPPSAESVRDALAKRREALAKSFGQKPGSAAASASAPRRSGSPKGNGRGAPSDQRGENGANEGQGHASKQGKGSGASHADAPPAELVFGDEANIDPERLAFEPLPQGHGGDDPGELYGLRAVDPHAPTDVPASRSPGATALGARAAGQREGPLLPRNRALIERYFQSK